MIRAGMLGARGKLRSWDEYVAMKASSSAFTLLDRWISDNMDAAVARGGDWAHAYQGGKVHAFVHSFGGTGPFLAGALAPSTDRAGRNYPLFAAAELQADGEAFASLELLPLALERLWDDAGRVVSLAAAEGTVASLGALLDHTPIEPSPDLQGAIDSWNEWTRAMELDELAALLFGAADRQLVAAALRVTFAAIAPHRGVIPLRTKLSLKLPLGRAGGAAVCFWLGIAQRALDWDKVVPSFFWTHDGESGSLLLHVGAPPGTTLRQLWMPAPAEDVVDVILPDAAGSTAHAGPALESALATDGATVADLFGAL
jgi:type VI secretion system ImpM family protein